MTPNLTALGIALFHGPPRELIDGHLLPGGFVARKSPPIGVDDWWRDELGRMGLREVESCSLWVTTSNPDRQAATELMDRFWLALNLHGIPRYATEVAAVRLATDAQGDTRTFARCHRYRPDRQHPVKVTVDHLERAAQTAMDIRSITARGKMSGRLKRSIHSMRSGLSHPYLDYQHHDCVRAMDALFRPGGQDDFARRGGLVVADLQDPSGSADALLRSMYKLRSKVEHCEPHEDAFSPGDDPATDGRLLVRRTRRLASDILIATFSAPALVDALAAGKKSVDRYWRAVDSGSEPVPFRVSV